MDSAAPLTPEALLRHHAFVVELARRLVRDPGRAEDVAQETFASALRRPPPESGARSWLARVARNHALELFRREGRGAAREREAAREEALAPERSATERLELEHSVVRAVLALDEPYRGTVVAAYSEGLRPSEIARRRGVPAGTVRSELSRALAKLRERLDREHGGDRRAWCVALGAIAARRTPPAAGLGAARWVLGAAAAGLAAVPLAVALRADAGATTAPLVAESGARTEETVAAPAPATVPAPARVAAEPEPQQSRGSARRERAELDELLLRTRQVKRLLIERRLAVDPSVEARYAWLENLPESGVTKLLDRTLFGYEIDLPWLDGGGAYYSFTERSHDYQRDPQVDLQNGALGQCGDGAVVHLGSGLLRQLAAGGGEAILGERERSLWTLLSSADLEARSGGSDFQSALQGLDATRDPRVEPGATYLLRARSRERYDVLVVLEAADVGDRECTLAWRILEERPPAEPRSFYVAEVRPEDVPPAARKLERMDEDALLRELDALRERAEELLLEASPREARGSGSKDAEAVRLVDRASAWTELPRVRGGGCYYSFVNRSWSYDDDPDVELQQGRYSSGFAGADMGFVLDVGDVPLDEAAALALDPALAKAVELLARAGPAPGEEVDLRDWQQRWREDWKALGLREDAPSVEGHTYLVRSFQPGEHDLLATFRVLERDDRGDLVAWRVARTWPAPRAR